MIHTVYRHYKGGGLYRFLYGAYEESTGRELIVYQCCETDKVYVRPLSEWLQKYKLDCVECQ